MVNVIFFQKKYQYHDVPPFGIQLGQDAGGLARELPSYSAYSERVSVVVEFCGSTLQICNVGGGGGRKRTVESTSLPLLFNYKRYSNPCEHHLFRN